MERYVAALQSYNKSDIAWISVNLYKPKLDWRAAAAAFSDNFSGTGLPQRRQINYLNCKQSGQTIRAYTYTVAFERCARLAKQDTDEDMVCAHFANGLDGHFSKALGSIL